ncbi:MAG: hypothetical protein C4288_14920 [Leptolyngbya sp. ERB_1_1]
MITSYVPEVFDQLNSFHTAKSQLKESKAFLHQLGTVICRHNLQQKVGLALLHKHFDLVPNERLVEQTAHHTISITPVCNPDDATIAPYLWKMATDSVGEHSWFPLEFQDTLEATPDSLNTAETLEANQAFLQEMAVKLQELNLEDVFGISILH